MAEISASKKYRPLPLVPNPLYPKSLFNRTIRPIRKREPDIFFPRQKNQHRYFPFRNDAYCWRTKFMNLSCQKWCFSLNSYVVLSLYVYFKGAAKICSNLFQHTIELIHQWSLSFEPTLLKNQVAAKRKFVLLLTITNSVLIVSIGWKKFM